MCSTLLFRRKFKSCWKKLDDNLIYYQSESAQSSLRIRNILSDQTKKYSKFAPKNLGLLSNQNTYLNIFIETQKETLFCKLHKDSLNLKVNYKIFQKHLFYNGPTIEFVNNIFLILQNQRLIQMSRNKMIRKYKGKLDLIHAKNFIVKMELKAFNQINYKSQCFDQFWAIFEKSLNIQHLNIDYKYSAYVFKKVGDFLILKRHNRFNKLNEQFPVYYVHVDEILTGNGMKGIIQLYQYETLKLIKYFNNYFYIVIQKEGYSKIYKIKYQRELIYKVNQNVKRPIIHYKHFIFTNRQNRYTPEIHNLDLINQKEIK